MRRLVLWGVVSGAIACLTQPTLVAITPDYGYVDGCVDVTITGHDLGTEATAQLIGDGGTVDVPLTPAEEDPELPEHAQDVGFVYYGQVPASPDLQPGWYDLTVTVGERELTLRDGWYYRSCPQTFLVEGYSVPADATVGSAISFQGCGLRDPVVLELVDTATDAVAATAPLVSDCSGAAVHADVPALPDGTYALQLVHPDGTTFFLETCSSDSGDTGSGCAPDVVVIGGGR